MKEWIKGSIAAFAVVCLFALPAAAVADASPKNNEKPVEKHHEEKHHHGKGYYEEEHHTFQNHCVTDYDEPRYRKADCGTACDPCGTNLNFNPSNFTFISSSLFWATCTNNLDFAVSAESFDGEAEEFTITGAEVHSVELDYDYGFRFTGVYQFPCDCWELRLSWTHFNPSHSRNVSTEDTGVDTVFVIGPTGVFKEADFITAHYKLEYNVFDLTLGKECCLCDKFSIRPYAGARFVWMDQKFRIRLEGSNFAESGSFDNWKADYTAGGIVGGIEGHVDIGCDFYLWGNFAASAVAGKLEMDQEINYASGGPNGITTENGDDPECIIATNFEAAMGIGYRFAYGCFDMDWRLAYEFVTWDNVPEANRYFDNFRVSSTTGGKHGSIGLHGVTLTTTTRF